MHLAFPFDVQKAAVGGDDLWADPRFGRAPALPLAPDGQEIAAAARLLATVRQPLVIAGGGVLIAGAEAALAAFAEKLAIPVATTVSGQGAIAETHPLAVGVVGSNGGRPETRAVVEAADCVIFVGCRAVS